MPLMLQPVQRPKLITVPLVERIPWSLADTLASIDIFLPLLGIALE
jgi:hypothetical protein